MLFCSVLFCSVEGGGTGRKRRVGGQVQERDGERRGMERGEEMIGEESCRHTPLVVSFHILASVPLHHSLLDVD